MNKAGDEIFFCCGWKFSAFIWAEILQFSCQLMIKIIFWHLLSRFILLVNLIWSTHQSSSMAVTASSAVLYGPCKLLLIAFVKPYLVVPAFSIASGELGNGAILTAFNDFCCTRKTRDFHQLALYFLLKRLSLYFCLLPYISKRMSRAGCRKRHRPHAGRLESELFHLITIYKISRRNDWDGRFRFI